MTASIGEQILEAIFTKFTAGISTATSYRSRAAAVALQEGSVLILEPAEEPVEYKANTLAFRTFTIKVTILARGAVPDQVADSVRVPMHAALMSDPTLGGLSLRIAEEASEWTFEEADQTAVRLEVKYKIFYATPTGSLTVLA